jgi:hypothetical protein
MHMKGTVTPLPAGTKKKPQTRFRMAVPMNPTSRKIRMMALVKLSSIPILPLDVDNDFGLRHKLDNGLVYPHCDCLLCQPDSEFGQPRDSDFAGLGIPIILVVVVIFVRLNDVGDIPGYAIRPVSPTVIIPTFCTTPPACGSRALEVWTLDGLADRGFPIGV